MKLYQPQVLYYDWSGSMQVYTNSDVYLTYEQAENALDDLVHECLESMDIEEVESTYITTLNVVEEVK